MIFYALILKKPLKIFKLVNDNYSMTFPKGAEFDRIEMGQREINALWQNRERNRKFFCRNHPLIQIDCAEMKKREYRLK